MNSIFNFLNQEILYKRCLFASVAHAIMVGEYDMLCAEQSWDGCNYNFQNMEGVRGVISFDDVGYICVFQNDKEFVSYTKQQFVSILNGVQQEIKELAFQEALQYMLINYNDETIPFISSAFWGNARINYSNLSEEELIKDSECMIMPFLYSESDTKLYWKNYYEMTDEQIELAEKIYSKRLSIKGKMSLTWEEVDKLKYWFDEIENCIESFQEIGIYIN